MKNKTILFVLLFLSLLAISWVISADDGNNGETPISLKEYNFTAYVNATDLDNNLKELTYFLYYKNPVQMELQLKEQYKTSLLGLSTEDFPVNHTFKDPLLQYSIYFLKTVVEDTTGLKGFDTRLLYIDLDCDVPFFLVAAPHLIVVPPPVYINNTFIEPYLSPINLTGLRMNFTLKTRQGTMIAPGATVRITWNNSAEPKVNSLDDCKALGGYLDEENNLCYYLRINTSCNYDTNISCYEWNTSYNFADWNEVISALNGNITLSLEDNPQIQPSDVLDRIDNVFYVVPAYIHNPYFVRKGRGSKFTFHGASTPYIYEYGPFYINFIGNLSNNIDSPWLNVGSNDVSEYLIDEVVKTDASHNYQRIDHNHEYFELNSPSFTHIYPLSYRKASGSTNGIRKWCIGNGYGEEECAEHGGYFDSSRGVCTFETLDTSCDYENNISCYKNTGSLNTLQSKVRDFHTNPTVSTYDAVVNYADSIGIVPAVLDDSYDTALFCRTKGRIAKGGLVPSYANLKFYNVTDLWEDDREKYNGNELLKDYIAYDDYDSSYHASCYAGWRGATDAIQKICDSDKSGNGLREDCEKQFSNSSSEAYKDRIWVRTYGDGGWFYLHNGKYLPGDEEIVCRNFFQTEVIIGNANGEKANSPQNISHVLTVDGKKYCFYQPKSFYDLCTERGGVVKTVNGVEKCFKYDTTLAGEQLAQACVDHFDNPSFAVYQGALLHTQCLYGGSYCFTLYWDPLNETDVPNICKGYAFTIKRGNETGDIINYTYNASALLDPSSPVGVATTYCTQTDGSSDERCIIIGDCFFKGKSFEQLCRERHGFVAVSQADNKEHCYLNSSLLAIKVGVGHEAVVTTDENARASFNLTDALNYTPAGIFNFTFEVLPWRRLPHNLYNTTLELAQPSQRVCNYNRCWGSDDSNCKCYSSSSVTSYIDIGEPLYLLHRMAPYLFMNLTATYVTTGSTEVVTGEGVPAITYEQAITDVTLPEDPIPLFEATENATPITAEWETAPPVAGIPGYTILFNNTEYEGYMPIDKDYKEHLLIEDLYGQPCKLYNISLKIAREGAPGTQMDVYFNVFNPEGGDTCGLYPNITIVQVIGPTLIGLPTGEVCGGFVNGQPLDLCPYHLDTNLYFIWENVSTSNSENYDYTLNVTSSYIEDQSIPSGADISLKIGFNDNTEKSFSGTLSESGSFSVNIDDALSNYGLDNITYIKVSILDDSNKEIPTGQQALFNFPFKPIGYVNKTTGEYVVVTDPNINIDYSEVKKLDSILTLLGQQTYCGDDAYLVMLDRASIKITQPLPGTVKGDTLDVEVDVDPPELASKITPIITLLDTNGNQIDQKTGTSVSFADVLPGHYKIIATLGSTLNAPRDSVSICYYSDDSDNPCGVPSSLSSVDFRFVPPTPDAGSALQTSLPVNISISNPDNVPLDSLTVSISGTSISEDVTPSSTNYLTFDISSLSSGDYILNATLKSTTNGVETSKTILRPFCISSLSTCVEDAEELLSTVSLNFVPPTPGDRSLNHATSFIANLTISNPNRLPLIAHIDLYNSNGNKVASSSDVAFTSTTKQITHTFSSLQPDTYKLVGVVEYANADKNTTRYLCMYNQDTSLCKFLEQTPNTCGSSAVFVPPTPQGEVLQTVLPVNLTLSHISDDMCVTDSRFTILASGENPLNDQEVIGPSIPLEHTFEDVHSDIYKLIGEISAEGCDIPKAIRRIVFTNPNDPKMYVNIYYCIDDTDDDSIAKLRLQFFNDSTKQNYLYPVDVNVSKGSTSQHKIARSGTVTFTLDEGGLYSLLARKYGYQIYSKKLNLIFPCSLYKQMNISYTPICPGDSYFIKVKDPNDVLADADPQLSIGGTILKLNKIGNKKEYSATLKLDSSFTSDVFIQVFNGEVYQNVYKDADISFLTCDDAFRRCLNNTYNALSSSDDSVCSPCESADPDSVCPGSCNAYSTCINDEDPKSCAETFYSTYCNPPSDDVSKAVCSAAKVCLSSIFLSESATENSNPFTVDLASPNTWWWALLLILIAIALFSLGRKMAKEYWG